MADLDEYRAKRRAGRTPEPLEKAPRKRRGAAIFVVQRHVARSLHYDRRLERDGVLASWALPRGVPLRGGERALAVHVEDHPLEYAHFEGRDPERRVRGRGGRHLGPGHLRARGRASGRDAHGAHARPPARGRVGARARVARREGAKLADRARGQGARRRSGEALRPDAPSSRQSRAERVRTGRSRIRVGGDACDRAGRGCPGALRA